MTNCITMKVVITRFLSRELDIQIDNHRIGSIFEDVTINRIIMKFLLSSIEP